MVALKHRSVAIRPWTDLKAGEFIQRAEIDIDTDCPSCGESLRVTEEAATVAGSQPHGRDLLRCLNQPIAQHALARVYFCSPVGERLEMTGTIRSAARADAPGALDVQLETVNGEWYRVLTAGTGWSRRFELVVRGEIRGPWRCGICGTEHGEWAGGRIVYSPAGDKWDLARKECLRCTAPAVREPDDA